MISFYEIGFLRHQVSPRWDVMFYIALSILLFPKISTGFTPVQNLHRFNDKNGNRLSTNSLQNHNMRISMNSIISDSKRVYSLGIDFGTSGVRINVIDSSKDLIMDERLLYSPSIKQSPDLWIDSLNELLSKIPSTVSNHIQSVSLCGTSASCLMVDIETGTISREVCMYDYSVISNDNSRDIGMKVLDMIRKVCPKGSAVDSATSTLAKLLSWHSSSPISKREYLAHQADIVLSYLLHGSAYRRNKFVSDWHNALKLGFDIETLTYPPWLLQLLKKEEINSDILPFVKEPGSEVGYISSDIRERFQLPPNCSVVAGTTDSIAAFLATGASEPGEAVTSLGSTTVLKLISTVKVEDSSRGVYSHRFMSKFQRSMTDNPLATDSPLWLVGGASNVGCSILRKENYSNEELEQLSYDISPDFDSPLKYYPLCKVGERFPDNDPNKAPKLDPKPSVASNLEPSAAQREQRRLYLHGILQGIANVEVEGYKALRDLGASPLTKVYTAGGGSKNPNWTSMRARLLGVPTMKAMYVEASYGCALLAQQANKVD